MIYYYSNINKSWYIQLFIDPTSNINMVAERGCDHVWEIRKKMKKWMENDKIMRGTVKLNKMWKLNKIEEMN